MVRGSSLIERGTEVEKYVVDAVLGQGGMAVVYRVHHRTLGGLHALKVLTIASEPLQRRLLQEGRAQARLQHPNVVEVRDVLDVRGFPGLLMEYVPDGSLADRIGRGGLSMAEIEVIFRGIVSGMRRAHTLGFIHRDLKPANVLLARQEERWLPKITDFGLVKCVEDSTPHGTRANVAMGTPGYMSPEQVRDSRGVDMRTDIFALGALLYEMVTGSPPFVGADISITLAATMSGQYTPIRELAPGVPDVFVAIIEGCLRADRRERLPDCEAVLALLGEPGQSSGAGYPPLAVGAVGLVPGRAGAGQVNAPRPSPSTFDGADGRLSASPEAANPSLVPERSLARSAVPVVATPAVRAPLPEAVRAPGRPVQRASGMIWAAGGLFGVGLVGALLVLGGIGLWFALRDGPEAVVVAPPVTGEGPADAPAASTPATSTPAAEARVAPASAVSRGPARGTITPSSAPAPVAVAEPAPSPAVVEPVPVATAEVVAGTVRVEGDALDVWLVDGTRRLAPGEVAPGTYAVEASFDASGAVPAGSVSVAAGEVVTLSCTAALFRCRVR